MRERLSLPGLLKAARGLAPNVALVLGSGGFLTVLRPFDSDALELIPAFAYWTGLVAVGAVTATWAAKAAFAPGRPGPTAAKLAAVAAAAATVVFVCLVVLDAATGGGVSPGEWPLLFFYVCVISAAITGFGYLLNRARRGRPSGPASLETPGAAFQDRLPARLRGARLFAVESEDHYLRVHTANGDDLILMRLSDAVRELRGLDGLQTHSSWWVAREAVADVKRGDGRLTLILVNGKQAPVSRSYARAVRAAGWV